MTEGVVISLVITWSSLADPRIGQLPQNDGVPFLGLAPVGRVQASRRGDVRVAHDARYRAFIDRAASRASISSSARDGGTLNGFAMPRG
jgi:hypothetical protein